MLTEEVQPTGTAPSLPDSQAGHRPHDQPCQLEAVPPQLLEVLSPAGLGQLIAAPSTHPEHVSSTTTAGCLTPEQVGLLNEVAPPKTDRFTELLPPAARKAIPPVEVAAATGHTREAPLLPAEAALPISVPLPLPLPGAVTTIPPHGAPSRAVHPHTEPRRRAALPVAVPPTLLPAAAHLPAPDLLLDAAPAVGAGN